MQAGVWREKEQLSIEAIDGKPPTGSDAVEHKATTEDCYTPEEMEDATQFFSAGAVENDCDHLTIVATNGVIKISGACTLNGIKFDAVGQGRYDEKSYSELINLHTRLEGHTVIAKGVMVGDYLHECLAGDPTTTI